MIKKEMIPACGAEYTPIHLVSGFVNQRSTEREDSRRIIKE